MRIFKYYSIAIILLFSCSEAETDGLLNGLNYEYDSLGKTHNYGYYINGKKHGKWHRYLFSAFGDTIHYLDTFYHLDTILTKVYYSGNQPSRIHYFGEKEFLVTFNELYYQSYNLPSDDFPAMKLFDDNNCQACHSPYFQKESVKNPQTLRKWIYSESHARYLSAKTLVKDPNKLTIDSLNDCDIEVLQKFLLDISTRDYTIDH